MESTRTNQDGYYQFTDLAAGSTYRVHVVMPTQQVQFQSLTKMVTLANSDSDGQYDLDFSLHLTTPPRRGGGPASHGAHGWH